MKKFSLLITTLLLTTVLAWAQKVMQVHSGGSVVYEIPTAQVDSITFKYGEPIEIPFTEYSLTGSSCQWAWANIEFEKANVINSKEELEKYIVCSESSYLEIDFSKYTLLLSRGVTTSGVVAFEKQLQQISIHEYSLYVDIAIGITTMPGSWLVAIIVPKLSQNAVVTLNTNVHP